MDGVNEVANLNFFFCLLFFIPRRRTNIQHQFNGRVKRVLWRYSANERRSYIRKSFI